MMSFWAYLNSDIMYSVKSNFQHNLSYVTAVSAPFHALLYCHDIAKRSSEAKLSIIRTMVSDERVTNIFQMTIINLREKNSLGG